MGTLSGVRDQPVHADIEEIDRLTADIRSSRWVREELRPYLGQPVEEWHRIEIDHLTRWLKGLPAVGPSLVPAVEPVEELMTVIGVPSPDPTIPLAQTRIEDRLHQVSRDLKDLEHRKEREDRRSGRAWEALLRSIGELTRQLAVLAAAAAAIGAAVTAAYQLVAAWVAVLWATVRTAFMDMVSWAWAFLPELLPRGAAALAGAHDYLVERIGACSAEARRLTEAFLASQTWLVTLVGGVKKVLVRLGYPAEALGLETVTVDETGLREFLDEATPTTLVTFPSPDPSWLTEGQRDLLERPIRNVGDLQVEGRHSNQALKVEYEDGSTAVYKPRSGETYMRPGFPVGQMYVREVATYRLDEALGLDLVPPTVTWEGPEGWGSLQRWADNAGPSSDLGGYQSIDQQKMAVLDYVAAHMDRNSANYLTDAANRPVAIDNGLSFPMYEGHNIESTFVVNWIGRPISPELLQQLRAIDPVELKQTLLRTGLEEPAVDAALARLLEVQQYGMITGRSWDGGYKDPATGTVMGPRR